MQKTSFKVKGRANPISSHCRGPIATPHPAHQTYASNPRKKELSDAPRRPELDGRRTPPEHDRRIIAITGARHRAARRSAACSLTTARFSPAIASALPEQLRAGAPPLNSGRSADSPSIRGRSRSARTRSAGCWPTSRAAWDTTASGARRSLTATAATSRRTAWKPSRTSSRTCAGTGTSGGRPGRTRDWGVRQAQAQPRQLAGELPLTRVGEIPPTSSRSRSWTSLPPGAPTGRLGDGSFGGPYQMSDEVMARLFDGVVEEAAALLASLK